MPFACPRLPSNPLSSPAHWPFACHTPAHKLPLQPLTTCFLFWPFFSSAHWPSPSAIVSLQPLPVPSHATASWHEHVGSCLAHHNTVELVSTCFGSCMWDHSKLQRSVKRVSTHVTGCMNHNNKQCIGVQHPDWKVCQILEQRVYRTTISSVCLLLELSL